MKKTKERIRALIIAFEQSGAHVSNTCKAVGISRKTFYEWKRKDQSFSDQVDEVAEAVVDNVESALYRNALEGNVTAQIFMLKCKGKERGYIERTEISGVKDKPIFEVNLNDYL